MKKSILIVLLTILVSSCATFFAPSVHPLALSSEPDGAEVFVNDINMGTTPVELRLKADKMYVVEFRKNCYEPVVKIINTEVGAGWVVLDILGGLIPVIVDAATGSWNKLDQSSVNVVLRQQN